MVCYEEKRHILTNERCHRNFVRLLNSNLKYLLRHWSYYYKNVNTFRTVIPRNQFYCSSRIFLENMSMSMEWETSTRVNNLLTTPIRQQQCIVKHDELYTMKEHFLLSLYTVTRFLFFFAARNNIHSTKTWINLVKHSTTISIFFERHETSTDRFSLLLQWGCSLTFFLWLCSQLRPGNQNPLSNHLTLSYSYRCAWLLVNIQRSIVLSYECISAHN